MDQKIIVAYDGTVHSRDALALARGLGETLRAELLLAHVYRTDQHAPIGREEFLRQQSEQLLQAADQPYESRSVAGTTTAMGLAQLAADEHALAIVFGSAYDGPEAHVHPGSAGRRLLQSAPTALAFAPAGFAARGRRALSRVAVAGEDHDGVARATAEALAATGGSAEETDGADLLVLSSRPRAEPGRVMTSAHAEQALQASTVPVLVLPAGVALRPGEPARLAHAAVAA